MKTKILEKNPYLMSKDIWPQIAEMLQIDRNEPIISLTLKLTVNKPVEITIEKRISTKEMNLNSNETKRIVNVKKYSLIMDKDENAETRKEV